jgi:hypothetical protein
MFMGDLLGRGATAEVSQLAVKLMNVAALDHNVHRKNVIAIRVRAIGSQDRDDVVDSFGNGIALKSGNTIDGDRLGLDAFPDLVVVGGESGFGLQTPGRLHDARIDGILQPGQFPTRSIIVW